MKKNKIDKKCRVFIIAPIHEDDTVYHICSTASKGNILEIYGCDEYEIEDTVSSENIKGPMKIAKSWAKKYGCKKVEVI